MEALQIYENTINHNHPNAAKTLINIGGVYNSKGAYD